MEFQGWDKLVAASNEVQTSFINTTLDPGVSRLAHFMVNTAQPIMHRKTFRMKNNTRAIRLAPLQHQFQVTVPYARRENSRPGTKAGTPHNYTIPTVNKTIGVGIPIFARETMQGLLNIFSKVKP